MPLNVIIERYITVANTILYNKRIHEKDLGAGHIFPVTNNSLTS